VRLQDPALFLPLRGAEQVGQAVENIAHAVSFRQAWGAHSDKCPVSVLSRLKQTVASRDWRPEPTLAIMGCLLRFIGGHQ